MYNPTRSSDHTESVVLMPCHYFHQACQKVKRGIKFQKQLSDDGLVGRGGGKGKERGRGGEGRGG